MILAEQIVRPAVGLSSGPDRRSECVRRAARKAAISGYTDPSYVSSPLIVAIEAVLEWEAAYAARLFEDEIAAEFRKCRPSRRSIAARAREQAKAEKRRAAVSATTELLRSAA